MHHPAAAIAGCLVRLPYPTQPPKKRLKGFRVKRLVCLGFKGKGFTACYYDSRGLEVEPIGAPAPFRRLHGDDP